MPNHLRNRLEIHCEDTKTMDKIKMMIFDEDENKNQIFTMNKMLPRPTRFSDSEGYNEYGYDWSRAMWGTKWDVYECDIFESGNSITIYYHTAWSPNANWVELLCQYIQETLCLRKREEVPPISIELHYYDYPGDFGGILQWVPFSNPTKNHYSFMEYAKLYDKELYECFSDVEDKMKQGNNDIIVIKGY